MCLCGWFDPQLSAITLRQALVVYYRNLCERARVHAHWFVDS